MVPEMSHWDEQSDFHLLWLLRAELSSSPKF